MNGQKVSSWVLTTAGGAARDLRRIRTAGMVRWNSLKNQRQDSRQRGKMVTGFRHDANMIDTEKPT